MALKEYEVQINGVAHTVQYHEGDQPEGAVEVGAKAKAPANKSRTAANKKS